MQVYLLLYSLTRLTVIQASEVPRQDIFLTTKLRNLDHVDVDKDGKFKLEDNGLNKVEQAFEISLSNLYTPYIDLCELRGVQRMNLLINIKG